MKVIFIKNYRIKIILFFSILLLWVGIFYITNYTFKNGLFFNVTINNYLSFSHPYSLKIDNILFNENFDAPTIETISKLKRSESQQFTNFKSLKGKISFEYPSAFELNEKEFTGSEIIYHVDFTDTSSSAHGFIQVWNLPYSLKEFLDKSKSLSQLNFQEFVLEPIEIDNLSGYYWDYTTLGNDKVYYKGIEVFFQEKGKMYRISYFIPKNKWSTSQSKTFWKIVNSFKIYRND